MKTAIFIVSCGKHFSYLRYCLMAIDRFAKGFEPVVLMIPRTDWDRFQQESILGSSSARVLLFDEWPQKGMLHHQCLEMRAYQYCEDAQAIVHVDSDMVFIEPVSPADFVQDEKPYICYNDFASISPSDINIWHWKVDVEAAIGGLCHYDTMRVPPWVHLSVVHRRACAIIEYRHSMSLEEYFQNQCNEFPQTVAEYPTLGCVAWNEFRSGYQWVRQGEPYPRQKLRHFWGHGPIDQKQTIWVDGRLQELVPIQVINSVLA